MVSSFSGLLKPSHSGDKLIATHPLCFFLICLKNKDIEWRKSLFYYPFNSVKSNWGLLRKRKRQRLLHSILQKILLYYINNLSLSDSSPTMSLNLVKPLFYLNSAGLSGKYLTILGNQASQRGESKTDLGFYLKGKWQRYCPVVENGQKIAESSSGHKGASQD